jgi:peptidyl-prolyl cis-trans isomerase SurA
VKSNRGRVLLAAAAAAAALTACAPLHAGAAAIVGDHRITTGELNDDVAALRSEMKAAGVDETQLRLPTSLRQRVLSNLVFTEQYAQIGAERGVTATDAEVDAMMKNFEQRAGNLPFDKLALMNGLTKEQGRDYVRSAVIQSKLAQQLGATTQADLDKKLGPDPVIKYNPRYGTPDAQGGFTLLERFGTADKD